MPHYAINECENSGVNSDRECQRQYGNRGKSRRFGKLAQSELKILDHMWLGVSSEMRTAVAWIQNLGRG
jgi:hypothetical protein